MTEQEFRALLLKDREEAIRQLFDCKVEEWMNDGKEEVVRVLTLWATRSHALPMLVLGDDTEILEMARNCELVQDDDGEDSNPRSAAG